MTKSTICLNMIVKNESHIILSTLKNVLDHINIDYWVISDTGSTDDTIDIINNFFKERGISGEMFCDEWKDFGHNRTKALEHAFGKSDYLFIFDADDLIEGNMNLPLILDKDCYNIQFENPVSYHRSILISNKMKWKYIGILHESIVPIDTKKSEEQLEGNYYILSRRLGNRSKNPNKYLDDAVILENAYNSETDTGLQSRYAFYCAQSYKDCGKNDISIKWYTKALTLCNWNQEKYYSCLMLGNLYSEKKDYINAIKYWGESYNYDKERFECIVNIMDYYYQNGQHFMVSSLYNKFKQYDVITQGKLFIDTSKYEAFHHYASISGSYCDEGKSAYEACKYILLNYTQHNQHNQNTIYNINMCYIPYFKEDKEDIPLIDFFINYLTKDPTKYIENVWTNIINIINDKYPDKYNLIKKSINKKSIDKNNKYSSSNKILVYTGWMTHLWNESHLDKKALGGSEKAVAYLMRELPKHYEIIVSGHIEDGVFDNRRYVNENKLQSILDTTEFHTIIISRNINFFTRYNNVKCFQILLSLHDTHILSDDQNRILNVYNNNIDKVVTLTPWHKSNTTILYPNINPDKIEIINNGIDVSLFNNNNSINKIKNKFIWSSRTERGLDILLKLWSDILEKIPDATLDICSYDDFPKDDKDRKMLETINIYNKSIIYHGKLNSIELYDLMTKSDYWLYTNTFPETSCITAMEMLMNEVICLYYPLAGLNDTIGEYGIPVNQGEEIETILDLTTEKKALLREKGKEYALSCSWKNRAEEWSTMLGMNNNNNRIGIFNSFPFHYEMFGFILNYAQNNNIEVDIFTNKQNNMGWLDFYKESFSNFNIIDFNNFNGNTNKYSTFFVTTDDDPLFKSEWRTDNVICINHYYKTRTPNFKHYLNIAQFKESLLDYTYPCYPLINYQDKIQNTTVCLIGGGYGFNNIINKLYSKNKIKLNIFTRKIYNTNISNIDTNKFDIHFKIAIDTTEMINEINKSSYIIINYNDNHDLNTGSSCSGSIQLALSTLCKPIMAQTSNKYLQIENALEFDIDSDEPINIDDEIDFKAIEEERNKYVDKFGILMNVYKIRNNLNLNKPSIDMNDFTNVINKFNLNLNNVFEIGALSGFDANVLSQKCKVSDVHIFEAVPNYCKNIKNQYPSFKINNCAINNYNGTAKFNIIKGNNNYGISSLRNRNKDVIKDKEEYDTVEVNSIRMDKYIEDNNIKSIDICKIDVEGCSYEVLEGFGKYLNYINFLHIESENKQCWENQKLTWDIFKLLENNFIKLSNFHNPEKRQIDSIFVNKNLITRYINESNIPKKIFQTCEHSNDKNIPHICVLYNILHSETIKYNTWCDGFAEAIKMLMGNENYKIDFINDSDNKNINFKEYDLILFKESFNGAIYNKYIKYITNTKIGLFISSSNIIPTDVEINKYDILFYETYWYYNYANLKRHPLSFHAFGINTNIMKPYNYEKIYDNIFVGAIIDFKNPLKMINKQGNNLCIGAIIDKNIEVQLNNNNIIVEDYVDYLSLSNKYNQSKNCYLPCSLHGGGERALLEARSCNITVEIDETNVKLKELLNSPIYDQNYYYSQINYGLCTFFNKKYSKQMINLIYHKDKGYGNFGDEISKFIIENLINKEKYTLLFNSNNSNYINIIGIGSYIQCAPNNCTIFGSGIRTNPPIEFNSHKYNNLNVKAVRGPLTKQFLEKKNIFVPDIYGDPALLLPLFYQPNFLSEFKNNIGLIPHISNYDLYLNKNLPANIILICPYDKWENIIDKIFSCKYIISSALHGLICADAYNKPNIWLNEFKLNEGEFKFKDYFLSQNRNWINISNIEELDETKLHTTGNIIDLEKLKNAFIYI